MSGERYRLTWASSLLFCSLDVKHQPSNQSINQPINHIFYIEITYFHPDFAPCKQGFIYIYSRGKNKNLTAQKSKSNTVWFNFQMYIIFSINLVSFKVTLRSSGIDILYGCHLLLDVCIYIYIYIYLKCIPPLKLLAIKKNTFNILQTVI